MSTYRAPLRDMQFVIRELAGFDEVAKFPGYEDARRPRRGPRRSRHVRKRGARSNQRLGDRKAARGATAT